MEAELLVEPFKIENFGVLECEVLIDFEFVNERCHRPCVEHLGMHGHGGGH